MSTITTIVTGGIGPTGAVPFNQSWWEKAGAGYVAPGFTPPLADTGSATVTDIGGQQLLCVCATQSGGNFNPAILGPAVIVCLPAGLAQGYFNSVTITKSGGSPQTFTSASATFNPDGTGPGVGTLTGLTIWAWSSSVFGTYFANGVSTQVDFDVPPPPPTFPVPGVIGLVLADAEAAIISAGFTVGTVTTANSFISAGSVSDQTPAGGTFEVAGFAVALVNSLGIVIPTVPLQALFVDAPVYKALLLANPGNINPRIYPPEVDTTARVLPQRIISS